MKLLARASALLTTVLVTALLTLVPVAPAQAAVNVFSIPTSNAGPGRIVTAPNGDMWFTEEDANQIGRITPQGAITEFDLPPTTTGEGTVMDLDIGPDGTIWVVYDSGWNALRINPDLSTANYDLGSTVHGDYPYGGRVRVAPNGVAFVTMNYDESFVVRLTPDDIIEAPNSPECEDVLGEAADGSMWCQGPGLDQLVRLNGEASGGTAYPLPSDATYPQGITAGPVGSIWFTRSSDGTIFTSPSNGSIGYLDQANGATTIWQTGSRSAPQDLVKAPDGTMWFTNRGAVPGIGHISGAGVGAISSVGNYEPTSLTWGADGAIWFTDSKNNSIVRVTTDQLQTTNVDLGTGVTMIAPNTPAPPTPTTPPTPVPPTPPAPGTKGLPTGAVVKPRGVVKVKKLKLPVSVSCPAGAPTGCIGTIRVTVGKMAITKNVGYRIASGRSVTATAKVSAKGKRLLKPGKRVKVIAALTPVGAKKPSASLAFRVRRK